MAFAAEEASFVANAEAYSFVSVSAFALLQGIRRVHGAVVEKDIPEDIPRVSFTETFTDDFGGFATRNAQWLKFCCGEIFNSCDAIERRFLNVIEDLRKERKVWAIGPFHPLKFDSNGGPHHYCLEWLDKQPQNSVIYVSFGTMTSISDAQIDELANGLEHSKQRFIWVLRDADRGDIYNGEVQRTQLPTGFEERVKGVGLVVRDWAPQLQILAHSSTGGFMSHCGWNSTIESLSMGVPIAAWPMHSDQPCNTFLVTDVLKVGLIVREWSRRNELISSHEIGSSVGTLMLSETGEMARKNAKELGIKVRKAVSDGGTSTMQIDSLLAHISR
ncbi:cis-zeatin O-beta-D-glucosyltransferase [Ranunculus cassubicifolius]